jgi:hypothetical protein
LFFLLWWRRKGLETSCRSWNSRNLTEVLFMKTLCSWNEQRRNSSNQKFANREGWDNWSRVKYESSQRVMAALWVPPALVVHRGRVVDMLWILCNNISKCVGVLETGKIPTTSLTVHFSDIFLSRFNNLLANPQVRLLHV